MNAVPPFSASQLQVMRNAVARAKGNVVAFDEKTVALAKIARQYEQELRESFGESARSVMSKFSARSARIARRAQALLKEIQSAECSTSPADSMVSFDVQAALGNTQSNSADIAQGFNVRANAEQVSDFKNQLAALAAMGDPTASPTSASGRPPSPYPQRQEYWRTLLSFWTTELGLKAGAGDPSPAADFVIAASEHCIPPERRTIDQVRAVISDTNKADRD